ncbi:MAG TPA: histidine kinase, partial [Chitinophagaceae bacterium]|nr:histidine kinase [Chitinophagaceae bacterium]
IVLNQLLTQLMHMYEVSETLTIKLNLTVNEAIVLADATQINRLFTNLIKNALEAQDAAEHAFINITLTANDQQYVVAIADKGAGIPAEVQASIFSPNFTTKTSGTGLGLAICKGIVERANGNIWFTTAAGQGTTFYVSFPKSV